jgi:hypothetical protein
MASLAYCVTDALQQRESPWPVAVQLEDLLDNDDDRLEPERAKIEALIELLRPVDQTDAVVKPGQRVEAAVAGYVEHGLASPPDFVRSLLPLAVADAYEWACTDEGGLRDPDPVRRQRAEERLEASSIGFTDPEVWAAQKQIQLPDTYFTWRDCKTEPQRQDWINQWRERAEPGANE